MRCFMFLHKKGFSLVELLTTVSVVGTLSVVGIRSQQAQVHKARSVEAKHSLSYVYNAEKNFYETWNTYHENLVAVGATPSGIYYYDVGFGPIVKTDIKQNEGNLAQNPLAKSLDFVECTNFDSICKGTASDSCAGKIRAEANLNAYSTYFSGVNCEVKGGLKSKDTTTAISTLTGSVEGVDKLGAKDDKFLVMATAELKNKDVWTINNEQKVKHVVDGTE